jgi:putative solute:sodium symporter small subunit
MGDPEAQERHDPRVLALKGGLLAVWVVVSFVFAYFARDLQFMVNGWPWDYWFAAQGAVLAFIAIVVVYAAWMRRLAPQDSEPTDAGDPDA